MIREFWKVLNTPIVFKKDVESKSHSINIFDYLAGNGLGNVLDYQAIRYYKEISPVATGVDLITDEIPALQLSVFDADTQEYDKAHDMVRFLRKPSFGQSKWDFFKEYSSFYKITGNVFMMATGNPNRPPLELFVISPDHVTENDSGNDVYPESYTYNTSNGSVTFTQKTVNKQIRYFNGDRELWPVKDFNPEKGSGSNRGASRLNAIYYEIEQHLESSQHNLSLLKRGGRPTGALITDQVLDDDTFERLKEQLQDLYAGSNNAGRMMIGEGGIKFQEMAKSNRDMDFATLKKEITLAIFNRLKIPLPLISPDTMTLANFESAMLKLYDNAVLPDCQKLFGELTRFIGPRFGLTEDQMLSVDPESIPALQTRQNEELKQQSELGVLTDNEMRSKIGREAIEGGDDLYKSATMIPVGSDRFTDDNLTEPEASRKDFEAILRQQKNKDGSYKFTDKQISELADREYK